MAETALQTLPESLRPLAAEYQATLCRFVQEPSEADRRRAHELGERLLKAACGPETLLDLHASALRHCDGPDGHQLVARANQLLAEASGAFIAEYRKQADLHREEADCYRRYARMLEVLNQDIMRLNQELSERHDELRKAHDEQVRLNQQKTDLLNMVSHEIRTPLTALLGYGEFLEEGTYGPLNPEQLDVLHKMTQSGKDLLLLLNNLLDMSRLEAGRLKLDRQPAPLTELIAHAVDQVEFLARRKELALDVCCVPEDLPEVWVDPIRIIQVMVNLLGNAIRFTEPRGSITIGAEAKGDMVEVWVRDTGIGISPEAQQRLFQRFSQVESVRRYGGTGLGLSITKELLAMHGGTIRVDSELGQGATFRFTLPIWHESDQPA